MSGNLSREGHSSLFDGQPPLNVYDDGRLRVEYDNYYAACDGRAVRLPRTEFLLLSRLAMNAGRVVESEELWRHAWGRGKPYNAESLHVHIYRLRRRLEPSGPRIETMVNVGYRLVPAAPASTPCLFT
jgi:DNA-binding response OmpR family regulator